MKSEAQGGTRAEVRGRGFAWSRGLLLGLIGLVAMPGGPRPVEAQEELVVTNNLSDAVTSYARAASGVGTPLRRLVGPATGLNGPLFVVIDPVHDELIVANVGHPNAGVTVSVNVYSRAASGDAAPLRALIAGPGAAQGVAVDFIHDELIVTLSDSIVVYPRTAAGNALPLRTLVGPATGLTFPRGGYVDLLHEELVVANGNDSILVFARTASGNTAPLRMLKGPATGLAGPNPVVDPVHDELVVANTFPSTVTIYPRTATGDTPPLRTLAGPATGLSGPIGVVVDTVHDELVLANFGNDSVTVYARTAAGNTAPIRTLIGGGAGVTAPYGAALLTNPLVAAVLPSSRSVPVGTAAGAFAAIINTGPGPAGACAPVPITGVPATFAFQTTTPQNQLVGTPNTPANIPAGATQNFVFAFTPTAPFAATDVQLGFACVNTGRAPVFVGVNTLLLGASATAGPDVIASAATIGNNGIVDVPGGGTGTGLFGVATSNVGATGTLTVSADTGSVVLPLALAVCQTNSGTGACLSPPAPTVTLSIPGGATPTFAIFVQGAGVPIPFNPAVSRVFVRLKDLGGVTRGSTSVAARTTP